MPLKSMANAIFSDGKCYNFAMIFYGKTMANIYKRYILILLYLLYNLYNRI